MRFYLITVLQNCCVQLLLLIPDIPRQNFTKQICGMQIVVMTPSDFDQCNVVHFTSTGYTPFSFPFRADVWNVGLNDWRSWCDRCGKEFVRMNDGNLCIDGAVNKKYRRIDILPKIQKQGKNRGRQVQNFLKNISLKAFFLKFFCRKKVTSM